MGWLSGIGSALGGIGSLVGALGGDDAAQMDPAIAAALKMRGIDISEFSEVVKARALQRGISIDDALQEAYTERYGPAEWAAAEYAANVFRGEGPGVSNMLANIGRQVGMDREKALEREKVRMAQQGITPDSPAYQNQLGQISRQIDEEGRAAATNFISQQIPQAMKVLEMGQTSERLAGVMTPGLERKQKIWDLERQIAEARKSSPGAIGWGRMNPRLARMTNELNRLKKETDLPTGVEYTSEATVPLWAEGTPGGAANQLSTKYGAPGSSGSGAYRTTTGERYSPLYARKEYSGITRQPRTSDVSSWWNSTLNALSGGNAGQAMTATKYWTPKNTPLSQQGISKFQDWVKSVPGSAWQDPSKLRNLLTQSGQFDLGRKEKA